jgi:hypothetical protein
MTLKPGTKVLVQYEATVTDNPDAWYPGQIRVGTPGHWDTFSPSDEGKLFSVLEEPEPEPLNALETLPTLDFGQKFVLRDRSGFPTNSRQEPVEFVALEYHTTGSYPARVWVRKPDTNYATPLWVDHNDVITLAD